MNSDGRIVLEVATDTSGVDKGVSAVKDKFETLKSQKATLDMLNEALKENVAVLESEKTKYAELIAQGKGYTKQAQQIRNNINEITQEIKEQQGAVDTLGKKSSSTMNGTLATLKTLVKYFVGLQTVIKAIRFSKDAAEYAMQTEANVQRLVDIYGVASNVVGDFIDENSTALGMAKAEAAEYSAVYGNLFSTWADQQTNAELTNKYLQATATIASKTGRTVEDVQERIRSGLLGNTEAIEDLGIFVNVSTIEMTDAFQRLAGNSSWQQLDEYTKQQIRAMAILEQSTQKYGTTVAKTTSQVQSRFSAAYKDFKNTWGTIAEQVLVPILNLLTQILNMFTSGLNNLTGKSGKVLENTNATAEGSQQTASSIEQQVDAQEDLNKELKKSLATFDDIQILAAQTSESVSTSAGATSTSSADMISSSGGGDDNEGDNLETAAGGVTETLKNIMSVVGGMLLAVGLVLLFFGQIAWGIGFITVGAAVFAVSQASTGDGPDSEEVTQKLKDIEKIVGTILVAIGILLLFLGQLGWGVGFVVAGAALCAVSEQETTGEGNEKADDAKEKLQEVADKVAECLVAVGVLLLFTGHIAWGLGFISAGAGLLSISELDPTSDPEEFKDTCSYVLSLLAGMVTYLVTKNLLTNWTTFVANWKILKETLMAIKANGLINTVTDLFKKPGAKATLFALAIAILAAGITFFASHWDDLTPNERIVTIFGALTAAIIACTVAVALFQVAWSVGLAAGAIAAGIALIAGTVLFQNFDLDGWLDEQIGSFTGTVPSNLSQFEMYAAGGTFDMPALAQGAVLPANHPFLALVGDQKYGTNIEAPLSTIEEAVENVLDRRGFNGTNGTTTTVEEHYYLNETELMEVIYKLAKGGEHLKGRSLVEI